MELGSRNQYRDGLVGLNSIMVVYVDPLRVYKGLHSLDLKGELLTCELRGLNLWVLQEPKPSLCVSTAQFSGPFMPCFREGFKMWSSTLPFAC